MSLSFGGHISSTLTVETFLFHLTIVLIAAKFLGDLSKRIGIPVVVGELMGGALIGSYGLGWLTVDPILHLLAQLGLILLLFEIGIETDLKQLIRSGPKALAVAAVGISLPFIGGYYFASYFGLSQLAACLIGGAFTATSIGITLRVLGELKQSQTEEGQIVLGAALIDDVISLLVLGVLTTVISAQTSGNNVDSGLIYKSVAVSLGFPVAAFVLGNLFTKPLLAWVETMRIRGALLSFALIMLFGFSWLAVLIGSSPIIGAFAAGLILSQTHQSHVIEDQIKPVADLLTPIFFVTTGAVLNIHLLNPFNPYNHTLLIMALIAAAIAMATKYISGFMAWGRDVTGKKLNCHLVGLSMAPRGEVVLVFAQLGISTAVITEQWFAVLILVIVITALLTPALMTRAIK